MSLYSDFKAIITDIKALSAQVRDSPLREDLATLRDRVLDLREKAGDAEFRHLEKMTQLKAEHLKTVEALQAENADLKNRIAQLEAKPPDPGVFGTTKTDW